MSSASDNRMVTHDEDQHRCRAKLSRWLEETATFTYSYYSRTPVIAPLRRWAAGKLWQLSIRLSCVNCLDLPW